MTRDEILAKSRNENKKMDEHQVHIADKAGRISMGVSILLCALITLVNSIFEGPAAISQTAWTVISGTHAANYWYQGIHLKDRSYILIAASYTVLFVLFGYLVLYHIF